MVQRFLYCNSRQLVSKRNAFRLRPQHAGGDALVERSDRSTSSASSSHVSAYSGKTAAASRIVRAGALRPRLARARRREPVLRDLAQTSATKNGLPAVLR